MCLIFKWVAVAWWRWKRIICILVMAVMRHTLLKCRTFSTAMYSVWIKRNVCQLAMFCSNLMSYVYSVLSYKWCTRFCSALFCCGYKIMVWILYFCTKPYQTQQSPNHVQNSGTYNSGSHHSGEVWITYGNVCRFFNTSSVNADNCVKWFVVIPRWRKIYS